VRRDRPDAALGGYFVRLLRPVPAFYARTGRPSPAVLDFARRGPLGVGGDWLSRAPRLWLEGETVRGCVSDGLKQ